MPKKKKRKPDYKQRAKYNREVWRKNNPVHYAYLTLKANAKRRNKPFEITLEDFKKFCYRYKYIGKKGRTAEGYGVDREREEDGYTLDNMRILKNGNNVKKYKSYDWESRTGTTVTSVETPDADNPF